MCCFRYLQYYEVLNFTCILMEHEVLGYFRYVDDVSSVIIRPTYVMFFKILTSIQN
jgi:hypothetical protein